MNLAFASQGASPEELRTAVQLDTQLERVQHMTPDELVAVQSRLGYGNRYGTWITPKEWLPAGNRKQSQRQIDFRERLTYCGIPDQRLEDALLYCARYAVLLALAPSGIGFRSKNKTLKPHTLHRSIYFTIPHLIAASCAHTKGNGNYVHAIGDEQLQNLSGSEPRYLRAELMRIHKFCDLGLWPDRPSVGKSWKGKDYTPEVAGMDLRIKEEPKKKKFLPLTDDWVAESGWRVLWLVKDLGPNLLSLGQQLVQIAREYPYLGSGVSKTAVSRKRQRRASKLIAAHVWVDRNGNDIVTPPFPLTIITRGTTPTLNPGQWPPTHATHIIKLLRQLQDAHLFIALLSVGSRISEMLSLEPGAITRSSDGTPFANGLTFKLTQLLEGEERDWPLPDIALEAISQQDELREVVTALGFWFYDLVDNESNLPDSLWVNYGSMDTFNSSNVNVNLRLLVKSLGLTTDPDGQNLSTHRFRKTLARLVALAVAGAPKILMDLFGHKSIEMTLYYILTDPDLAAEVKQVSEEMVVMRAVTAIENIDDYGGRAALSIKRMVEQERVRLGKDLGANDIRELAEILTMNGQSWELSRPGVICTKLPGSYGECAKKVGHPEPSHCGPGCDHRLEEAFLRKDVNGVIADSILHYETERDAGNSLMQDFWAGQVAAHLKRFDDLREKWSAHPSVQEIVSGEEQPA